jgi:hypothetical protein
VGLLPNGAPEPEPLRSTRPPSQAPAKRVGGGAHPEHVPNDAVLKCRDFSKPPTFQNSDWRREGWVPQGRGALGKPVLQVDRFSQSQPRGSPERACTDFAQDELHPRRGTPRGRRALALAGMEPECPRQRRSACCE